ncbi:phosphatase PAP2 family protein [Tardiphaga sp. 804_B3_N1_9]|uniref:phosphatase PAP2 family protein n=1 Tax=Tardiphaga TaxID=1395974 RepID=UPI001585D799|nr:phosphatase PAP2 family protein [Tardiphaga robiniae]NUU42090.1 phosphatase PAP2 family protein [Tardiphaga robiniae]
MLLTVSEKDAVNARVAHSLNSSLRFLVTITAHVALLARGGATARRLMKLAWSVIIGLAIVDLVWLAMTDLQLAPSSWIAIVRVISFSLFAVLLCELISQRLQGKSDPIGRLLKLVADYLGTVTVAMVAFALLAAVVIIFCCLAANASLPLQDLRLAALDASLGFDWKSFVASANSNNLISRALLRAYQNTGHVLLFTMLWLCLSNRLERLAEFMALLCLTSIGIAAGMLILPGAGAYALHQPALNTFSNFGADAGTWWYQLLMQFRSAQPPLIDFDTPNINCLVTFPSGHTILGLITTYALRDRLYTFLPALLLNGVMIISTLPVGGHYLADLIGSGAVSAVSIAFIHSMKRVHSRTSRSGDNALAGAI